MAEEGKDTDFYATEDKPESRKKDVLPRSENTNREKLDKIKTNTLGKIDQWNAVATEKFIVAKDLLVKVRDISIKCFGKARENWEPLKELVKR